MFVWFWLAAVAIFAVALGWEDYKHYRRFMEGE